MSDNVIMYIMIVFTLFYCRLLWVVLDIRDDTKKIKEDVVNMWFYQTKKERKEQEKQNGTDAELIRCKDCKHREWDVIDVPYGQTKRIDWCNIRFNADGENVEVAPNDFCSCAERKEE